MREIVTAAWRPHPIYDEGDTLGVAGQMQLPRAVPVPTGRSIDVASIGRQELRYVGTRQRRSFNESLGQRPR
jgi:hypothetical protein